MVRLGIVDVVVVGAATMVSVSDIVLFGVKTERR
jgi:hypothetical protein